MHNAVMQRSSEKKEPAPFRTLLAHTPDRIFLVRKNAWSTTVVAASDSARALTFAPDVFRVFWPDSLIASCNTPGPIDVDGNRFELTWWPMDRAGTWALVLVRDESQLTQEERVQLAQEQWARVFDSISDAVVMCAGDVVQRGNRAFAAIANTDVRQLRGLSLSAVLSAHGVTLGALREGTVETRTGESWQLREHLAGPDGDWRVMVIHDVTDELRARRLEEAVNQMDNLGAVFSGIRHELGNPVNSLKMMLSVVDQNITALGEHEILSYIGRCRAEIERIEYLLRNLRAYSGNDAPTAEAVDVGAFLETFRGLSGDRSEAGAALKIHPPPRPLTVRTDSRALYQVLLNLVSNAFDATAGMQRGEVDVFATSDGSALELVVRDNGMGMSPAQLKRLFTPFQTTKRKGTGLGLVIVRRIVQRLGGTLRLSSELNQGTTATVRLPLNMNDGQERSTREEPRTDRR